MLTLKYSCTDTLVGKGAATVSFLKRESENDQVSGNFGGSGGCTCVCYPIVSHLLKVLSVLGTTERALLHLLPRFLSKCSKFLNVFVCFLLFFFFVKTEDRN